MNKKLTLLLLVFFPWQSLFGFCADELRQMQEKMELTFSARMAKSSEFDAFLLKSLKNRMRKNILLQCEKEGKCDPAFVEEQTHLEVEKWLVRSAKVKGFTLLLSSMFITAYATHRLSDSLPKNWQFLCQFTNQVALVGIIVFGAPLWQKLAGRVQKLGFFTMQNHQGSQRLPTETELNELWSRTGMTVDVNEQMARNTIAQFLQGNSFLLKKLEETIQSTNAAEAAETFAQLAVLKVFYFGDLNPDQVWFTVVFKKLFKNFPWNKKDFLESAVRSTKEILNTLSQTESDLLQKTTHCLEIWLS